MTKDELDRVARITMRQITDASGETGGQEQRRRGTGHRQRLPLGSSCSMPHGLQSS